MKFPIVYEKINSNEFPKGYYYAHIPTLGLTTHGEGLEGAKDAAFDLVSLWLQDCDEQETEKYNSEVLLSVLEM